jgi:hypothetical protein
MITRRNFFARTFGAVFTGFAAVILPKPRPRNILPIVYMRRRVSINPDWVSAGPESDIHFICAPDQLRVYQMPVGPGTYPDLAGETIRKL